MEDVSSAELAEPALGGVEVEGAPRAWIILFLDAAMLLAGALYWLVRGRLFDAKIPEAIAGSSFAVVEALSPGTDRLMAALVRLAGALGVVAGVSLMALAGTGLRRGDRSAWYVMWALVVYPTLDFAVLAGYGALTGASASWDAAMALLALGGLLATAPR